MTATSAAIAAFREAFRDPSQTAALAAEDRRAYFALLWAYYKSTVFEDLTAWQSYRQAYSLYRNIRGVYNPTRRLVEFYVSHVYPGVLSEDARALPDGVQLAIPLAADTDARISGAVAQFWRWSNWQTKSEVMVRYGSALGSAFVEVVDEREKGKVTAVNRWPGLVSDLVLDDVGNVKAYVLEYEAEDEDGKPYTYRKEVDGESFRYFKDDSPFTPEGRLSSVEENAYGFVPAVWCKHVDEGDDYGAPAMSGSLGKLDELNGLASHVHDHVDQLIDSPGIIASSGAVGRIGQERTRAASDEYSATSALVERNTRRLLLKAPENTTWVPLTGNLAPEKVEQRLESIYAEIERDHPELKFWENVREKSQISGRAVEEMSGDVKARLGKAAKNYDQQSVKLFQMALAIGGFRYAEGREGWRTRTAQQTKFAPFSLESYSRGELDFSIMPRPLVPQTEDEAVSLQGKRLDNARKAREFYHDDKVLEIAGEADEATRRKIIDARAQQGAASGTDGIVNRLAEAARQQAQGEGAVN